MCRLFSNYYALSYLSLADTSTLFFVSPILVGLMGFLILREPYSLVEFLVGLASLSGTVFIAKPTFLFSASEAAPDVPGHEVTPEERARAVTVVLVGVVFASSISIIIRYIGTRANALHSIAYFSIYSVRLLCRALSIHSLRQHRRSWSAPSTRSCSTLRQSSGSPRAFSPSLSLSASSALPPRHL